MIKYENYITFLRILPDFNLCHQLRVINERFINNRADHIPEEIRNELNNKNFLQLGTFYIYVFLLFPLLMVWMMMVNNTRAYIIIFISVHIPIRCGKQQTSTQN